MNGGQSCYIETHYFTTFTKSKVLSQTFVKDSHLGRMKMNTNWQLNTESEHDEINFSFLSSVSFLKYGHISWFCQLFLYEEGTGAGWESSEVCEGLLPFVYVVHVKSNCFSRSGHGFNDMDGLFNARIEFTHTSSVPPSCSRTYNQEKSRTQLGSVHVRLQNNLPL